MECEKTALSTLPNTDIPNTKSTTKKTEISSLMRGSNINHISVWPIFLGS